MASLPTSKDALHAQRRCLTGLGYDVDTVERYFRVADGMIENGNQVLKIVESLTYRKTSANAPPNQALCDVARFESASCLESALIAYDLTGLFAQERIMLTVNRRDPRNDKYLGHAVMLYRENSGQYGAASQSRHKNMRCRKSIFESAEDLVLDYAQIYMSLGLEPVSFGMSDPAEIGKNLNWHHNGNDMRSFHDRLKEIPHHGFEIE